MLASELLASKGPEEAVSFEDVIATTGPFAFTKAIMGYFKKMTGLEYIGDELGRLEKPRLVDDVLVLSRDNFGWLPHNNTHEKGDPIILVEHLFMRSWRGSHPD